MSVKLSIDPQFLGKEKDGDVRQLFLPVGDN